MADNNSLDKIREKINETDNSIAKLFEERMELSAQVAEEKRKSGGRIYNPKREREIVNRLTEGCDEKTAVYLKILYNTVFNLSRSYQAKLIYEESKTAGRIKTALSETGKLLPQSAVVACQGTEGAYSQQAAEKLFSNPGIMYFDSFRGVFNAVKSGLCAYGVLPLENSVFGSVTEVVDLMREYDFSIVKSVKTQINHCLMAKPGTDIKNIKEVYSHEQAIGQCDKYLEAMGGVKLVSFKNTAAAAKMVSESERDDLAAVASPACADIYGLKILNGSINNSENNYTRFICISKKTEIYPGADKMSFIVSVPHKPGSLYNLISKFAALGIDLTKIESRPIPGKDFEFMFYFEMTFSVYSDNLAALFAELEDFSEDFKFLGAYTEC